jgi:glucans biosynthesis protein C
MPSKRKEQSIETLRGVAIILMVAGHVIGHNSSTGLVVGDDSVWRYFYFSFEYLRMPLFTAISGFVYALKPVTRENIEKFIKGKARRILLPLVFVASLQYTLNALIPNVNNPTELKNIWTIYFFSYGQFWFLQALFLVFLLVVVLEYFNLLTHLKGWAIVFASASVVLIFTGPDFWTDFFSISRFFYLLPFFILGIGIKRFSGHLMNHWVIWVVLTILTAGLILQQLNWFSGFSMHNSLVRIVGVFIGIAGIWMLFRIRRPYRFLAELGYYSYGIYLFHVFGTAGSRIISQYLGIENLLLLFIIGLVFGLGLPILIELALLRSKILRRLFLGLK